MDKNPTRSHAAISAVVTSYFIVSISMVFINKVLLSDRESSIPVPFFITAFQCATTSLICFSLGQLGKNLPSFAEFPIQHYSWSVAYEVLPLSAIFVGMITFNNLCLQYVEVSFYNVARSLTIVMNVIFSYFFLGQNTSVRTLLTLVVTIAGFFVGAEGEVNFSLLGTSFGVLSSFFVSLNSIYTKKALQCVQDQKWRLAFYNNVNALFMFVPLIFVVGEWSLILENWEIFTSAYFWFTMTIAGVLGFLINIVTVMQIQFTSPLTHNIAGTAKACVQTILALYIWKNQQTGLANLGLVMTLFGSMFYAYVRMEEENTQKAAAQAEREREAKAAGEIQISIVQAQVKAVGQQGDEPQQVKTA